MPGSAWIKKVTGCRNKKKIQRLGVNLKINVQILDGKKIFKVLLKDIQVDLNKRKEIPVLDRMTQYHKYHGDISSSVLI